MSELQAVVLFVIAAAGDTAFPRWWDDATAIRLMRIANDRGWCWHCRRLLMACDTCGEITCNGLKCLRCAASA